MLSWLPFLKLKGLLGSENPNLQKCVNLKKIISQFEITKGIWIESIN